MLIIKALNHPQSKNFLIKASQIINTIIADIIPETKKPIIPPITVPKITIHSASINRALLPPTRSLPAIQRTGVKTIALTITCISNPTKFKVIN